MGRQPADPPEFLVIGRILTQRGIRGELKVQVMTDFPERFEPGETVYLHGIPLKVESCRPYKHHLLVKLHTVDTAEAAGKLRGYDLTIPRSELRPLPEGEYYTYQLIGLEILTTEGKLLGEISDIITTAGNDIYVVRGESGELLIPAIEDVVKSIDLEKRAVIIEAIEGLLPPS